MRTRGTIKGCLNRIRIVLWRILTVFRRQALKCNTHRCPTGVATLDPKLMNGLVVSDKTVRVQRYQDKTVHSAVEIMAAAGVSAPGGERPTLPAPSARACVVSIWGRGGLSDS